MTFLKGDAICNGQGTQRASCIIIKSQYKDERVAYNHDSLNLDINIGSRRIQHLEEKSYTEPPELISLRKAFVRMPGI